MNRRLRWISAAFGLCGLLGLVLLARGLQAPPPWLRRGLWAVVAWQLFWYLVRAVVMVPIWRRETALSWRLKVWVALTVPLPVLFGIWTGRGKLSEWIVAEESTG